MATSNDIVLENEKPGNPESEWGLPNGPYSNIEGFATSISVDVGERVEFKINTPSSHYRIDIYRLGFYGGDGARLVASIEHNATSATSQPQPNVDLSTGVVDAGNWLVTDAWVPPEDAISGVYIAKLVREDGVVGENHIPFIIRDDSSHSDVIFQTSDQTWQAYNSWGGSSLYSSTLGNPQLGDGDSYVRAYGVSYNRPTQTYLVNGSVLASDYATIRWLEQNGYDVTYQSGLDTALNGELLLDHKVFMDAGHDEYWSGEQRTNVEAARDAGVNIVFMSGNLMYWKTRWEPGVDGSPNRTLINYKESADGANIDPSPVWTGLFRDPSSPDGAQPENALTGTLFIVNGDIRSIQVPYEFADFHLWANTSVANLEPGESASLEGLLGYEWDIDADNGFRPAGLISLSSTTATVDTLITPDSLGTTSGEVTHNLTLYRASSGALVFSAGSIFFSWGLDSPRLLTSWSPPVPDPNAQQFMVNLLAEMGVQPESLKPGLVPGVPSTDFLPPETHISSLNSLAGSLVVGGVAIDTGGGVIAATEVSTDGGQTWHKPIDFGGQWFYQWEPATANGITVLARSVDDSVNLGSAAVLPIEIVTVSAGVSQVTINDQVAALSDPNVASDAEPESPTYSIIGGGDAGQFTIDSQTGELSFVAPPDYFDPVDFNGDNTYEVWVTSTGFWDAARPLFVRVTPSDGSTTPQTTIWSLNAVGDLFVVGGVAASSGGSLIPTEVSIDGGVTWYQATGDQNWYYSWAPTQTQFAILARSTDHSIDSENPAALTVKFEAVTGGSSYVTTLADPSVDPNLQQTPTYAIVGGGDADWFIVDSQTGVLSFVAPPDFAQPADLGGNNIYETWVSSNGSWAGAYPLFVRVTPADGLSNLHTSILSLNSFAGYLVVGGTSGDFGGGDVAATQVSTDGGLTWQTATGAETWNYLWQPTQGDFTLLARAVDASQQTGAATALPIQLDTVTSGARYVTTLVDSDSLSGDPTFSIIGGGDALRFSIDSQTGVLSFNSVADYAHPTDLGGDNVYEVWVSSSGSWAGAHPLFVTVTPAVSSQILTGDSADNIFYASATAEAFVGQGGEDTVSYAFAGSAVTASLAEVRTNTGDAAGDSYSSIEKLIGSPFNDILTGDDGSNILQGGLGSDLLNGGQGKDVFLYRSPLEGGDTINNFVVADDTLSFSASGFGGGLSADQHVAAGIDFIADAMPSATVETGTFLYNTVTQDLFWDVDGSGVGEMVQIAHFDSALTLTPDHFDIAA